MLVHSSNVSSLTIPDQHKEPFEIANCGGLSEPTEFCFVDLEFVFFLKKSHLLKRGNMNFAMYEVEFKLKQAELKNITIPKRDV